MQQESREYTAEWGPAAALVAFSLARLVIRASTTNHTFARIRLPCVSDNPHVFGQETKRHLDESLLAHMELFFRQQNLPPFCLSLFQLYSKRPRNEFPVRPEKDSQFSVTWVT